MRTMELVRVRFFFKLGNDDASFWFDEWLRNFKICDKLLVVDIHDIDANVRM